MIADLLYLGSTEVLNSARTNAYISAGFAPPRAAFRECGCDRVAHLLETDYDTPFTDKAPWIDERRPESYDFAGVLPLGVSGGDNGTISRTVVQGLSGPRLTRQVCGPRRTTFSGLLVGATCCSTAYGLEWLRNVLLGTPGGTGCAGDVMEYLDCCPDCDRVPGSIVENCPTSPGLATLTRVIEACECYQEVARCQKDVALESGPIVTDTFGAGCGSCSGCPIIQVEWTMVSARPFAYGRRDVVAENRLFPAVTTACDPVWTTAGGECEPITEDCDDGIECELEIPCAVIPPPPVPSSSLTSCICDNPLSVVTDTLHFGGAGDEVQIPVATHLVPILTVAAGSNELRNVTLRFYSDPLDLGCDQFLTSSGRPAGDCRACSTIHITQLPAGSVLEIDGEAETVRLICRGGVIDPATQILYGPGGGAYSLPVFGETPYCVVVSADSRFVSADSSWGLTVVERSA